MKLDIEQHHDDGLIDYLLMGGSLTLVVFTILTVITGYYFCYYRKKTRGKTQADMNVHCGQYALLHSYRM